jgi:hypothetical protein
MRSKARSALVALAVTGLVATGAVTAPASTAYPAGENIEIVVRSQSVVAGKNLGAGVRKGQPGCAVTFRLRLAASTEILASRVAEIGPRGRAVAKLRVPAQRGAYIVSARQSGPGCLPQADQLRVRAS